MRVDELLFDGGQREQHLAQRKGGAGADLEDGKAVLHQLAQGLGPLVVGGVGLEDQLRVLAQQLLEVGRFTGRVVHHARVIELHAGLDHHGNDARPDRVQPLLREDVAVHLQRALGVGAGSDLHMLQRMRGAAGHGHFGADHVDGAGRRAGAAALGRLAEQGSAAGHGFVVQRLGVVCAGHAGVQVQLHEAGRRIGVYQVLRQVHGLGGRQVRPRRGAQVVAAQQHAVWRQADAVGDGQHEAAEVGGLHAGVAAELVDLVGGGLHQQRRAVVQRLVHGGLDDQGMGRADGVDAECAACCARIACGCWRLPGA